MVAKYTATVIGGRLVLKEPTDLPEGVKVDVTLEWSEEQLPEGERESLWACIEQSRKDAA